MTTFEAHEDKMVVDFESKLYSILEDSLNFQFVEAVFAGLIIKNPDDDEIRKNCFLEAFKGLWSTLANNQYDGVLQSIVAFANEQKTQARIDYIYELIQLLVDKNFITSKRVCETVLPSSKFNFKERKVWHRACLFIHHNVQQMDYKSVRVIFAVLLSKINEIPNILSSSEQNLLDDLKNVIMLIADKNSSLLPTYCVVNEICKLYPVESFHPHWAFGKIFTEFVDSFKPLAQMVTITGRSSLLPIVGHSSASATAWKLEPSTLKFVLKGPLPYSKEIVEPQRDLVQYTLAQPYSRDLVCNMLGLNKQQKKRCAALEELLAGLMVIAMERSENETENDKSNQLLWQHLSSQLIFFVLFQFASFPHMLSERNLFMGRDQLMWVLLQFISGSIQKFPLSDFLPVMKLFDALYPDDEPLPVPDVTKPESTAALAVTCIWVHISMKAKSENPSMARPPPRFLQSHLNFLIECLESKPSDLQNYKIALLCNAYSTNPDNLSHPMSVLVDMCYGSGTNTVTLPGDVLAASPISPCPMEMLDSLTVHAKMSLIHSIVSRVIRLANSKSTVALAPALVETYSRLLVYMEIELLGIKGFISQLLPNVFKSKAWGILHTLFEMFSYRLHHIQPHYRVTLLSHLHSLATVPLTNKHQLHLCFQSTALRLITGFDSSEVQPQFSSQRIHEDPKQILSKDYEELNRVLILTIARAIHVTGSETLPLNWCDEVLKAAITVTPHRWANYTLDCFPKAIQQFYRNTVCECERKDNLRRRVEEKYRYFKGLSNEKDIVNYFGGPNSSNIFLCVVWKILFETKSIPVVCHKVLMEIGARALSTHIRVFADYLVYEVSTAVAGEHVNICIQHLNDMVWRYNIFTLDRLVLSMALRHHEGNEAQVCFFIIQLLLLTPSFKNRVNAFVCENSPDHWKQTDWLKKHCAFHADFPEKLYFEGLYEANDLKPPQATYLPIYFGNVCLRFLPVFDIVIHRFLELPPVSRSLESLLDQIGSLYKFHDRPITYLYNTLHYSMQKLKDRPLVKKKLVGSIIGAQKECHPPGWALSEGFLEYLARHDDVTWTPSHSYFCTVIGRLVDTTSGKMPSPFPSCDWRFNEFPNPTSHALHVTCVELMALPITCEQVGEALFNVLYKSSEKSRGFSIRRNIMSWINAVAVVLTSLPESSWLIVNNKVCNVLQNELSNINFTTMSSIPSFFEFSASHAMNFETHADYVLALFHAFWHHSSNGQFVLLPNDFKQKGQDAWLEYHLKYMFVGNSIKEIAEKTIGKVHESIQTQLKFMTDAAKKD
eukprot:gene4577-5179_t